MTREEIRAVYDTGPEAVIALVEKLFLRIDEQEKKNSAVNSPCG